MKYCKYCGKQLADEALFCSGCGRATDAPVQPAYAAPAQKKSTNVICILGFIFSLISSFVIVGLILSIVGYNQVKNTDDATGKSLSKAGIIISSIMLGLVVLVVFIFICIFVFGLTIALI